MERTIKNVFHPVSIGGWYFFLALGGWGGGGGGDI